MPAAEPAFCVGMAEDRPQFGTSLLFRSFSSTGCRCAGPGGQRRASCSGRHLMARAEDQGQPEVPHGLWGALKMAIGQWSAHRDTKAGAAIAYYSIFSIGP